MTRRIPELAGARVFAAACILCVILVRPVLAAVMQPVPTDNCPVFRDDLDFAGLREAIEASIAYYEKLPQNRVFRYGPDSYPAGDLIAGLRRFERFVAGGPDRQRLNAFLEKNARVYAFMEGGQPVRVLFTGYYEPLLAGSRTKTETFRYPVYGRPRDLVRVDLPAFGVKCDEEFIVGRYAGKEVVPYYDRRTIETADVLAGMAEPLAWVADPVKRFFLHVQGSGLIVFEDGSSRRLQFDITNGRPYRSIGRYLIDKGAIPRAHMSMQAIADYLRQHPGQMAEVFFHNPRYVFFRKTESGPAGSLGVALTPGRSVALDPAFSPPGALLFVSASKPVCNRSGAIDHWTAFCRFMCGQDAGSAIRGEKRADIFWGSGDCAEIAAGFMKHRGLLYFLVIVPPTS